jgi:hypothetical protein
MTNEQIEQALNEIGEIDAVGIEDCEYCGAHWLAFNSLGTVVCDACAEGRRYIDNHLMRAEFDESDCGGVWDGFGVISDADPGL